MARTITALVRHEDGARRLDLGHYERRSGQISKATTSPPARSTKSSCSRSARRLPGRDGAVHPAQHDEIKLIIRAVRATRRVASSRSGHGVESSRCRTSRRSPDGDRSLARQRCFLTQTLVAVLRSGAYQDEAPQHWVKERAISVSSPTCSCSARPTLPPTSAVRSRFHH